MESSIRMCLKLSMFKTELIIFSSQPASPNAYFLLVNDIIVLIIQIRSLELMLNHSFILSPTFAHSLNHSAYTYF